MPLLPRQRRRHTAPSHEGQHAGRRDVAVGQPRRAERAELRRKRDLSRSGGDVQRLDPESIAREQQRPVGRVPHREREHAADSRETRWTVARDETQEHFGVAAGDEALAARLEIGAQGAIVVDLAVEHDAIAALRRGHGLRSAGPRIDDGETPVHEQDVGALGVRRHPRAGAVRTAVSESGAESRGQCRHVALQRAVALDDAGDSAH